MVPSVFLTLDRFPLNQNGKIDMKKLPIPKFGMNTVSNIHAEYKVEPKTDFERTVHSIWCQVFQQQDARISMNANFFSLGGNSLLLVKLYSLYQTQLKVDAKILSIATLFKQAKLCDHVELLLKSSDATGRSDQLWVPLNIQEGMIYRHS